MSVSAPAAGIRIVKSPPLGLRAEEATDGRPDIGVVEQVEVVNPAEPAAEVQGERDVLSGSAPPVRAGRLDEPVTGHGVQRGQCQVARGFPAGRLTARPSSDAAAGMHRTCTLAMSEVAYQIIGPEGPQEIILARQSVPQSENPGLKARVAEAERG